MPKLSLAAAHATVCMQGCIATLPACMKKPSCHPVASLLDPLIALAVLHPCSVAIDAITRAIRRSFLKPSPHVQMLSLSVSQACSQQPRR